MTQVQNMDKSDTENEPLPTTPEDILALLEDLGVDFHLYHHAPIFTVAEGAHLKIDMPGVHCRNLYMRDNKKNNILVVAANETQIDLKKLPDLLGCGRLSFGSADRLWEYLGIRPGSVNPFTVINDRDNDVALYLDAAMMEAALVNVHPMDNARTVGLAPRDLLRFLDHIGHSYTIVDLSAAAP